MQSETEKGRAEARAVIEAALKAADRTLKANRGNPVIERNVMVMVENFWDSIHGRNGRTLEGGVQDARWFMGLEGIAG